METLIEKEAGKKELIKILIGAAGARRAGAAGAKKSVIPNLFNLGKKPAPGGISPLDRAWAHPGARPGVRIKTVLNPKPTTTPATTTTTTTAPASTPSLSPEQKRRILSFFYPTRATTSAVTGTASAVAGTAGAGAGAAAAGSPGKFKKIVNAIFGRSIKKPKTDSDIKYGWGKGYGRPLVVGGATLGAGYGGTSALLANSLKDDTPLPPASADTYNTGSLYTAPLVGASAAGLGSLLYGKLKDKPSLQRDLISTLIGGSAGIAYNLVKSGADADAIEINARSDKFDKEAWVYPTIMGVTTAASFIPMFMGGDKDEGFNEALAKQTALEQSNYELTRSIDKSRRGFGGAVLGGSLLGMASNLYGRAKNKESLRRDLLATISGTILGGAAGVYSA